MAGDFFVLSENYGINTLILGKIGCKQHVNIQAFHHYLYKHEPHAIQQKHTIYPSTDGPIY
jgi:hypothetical protein